jgi:Spy/CpxP family protein refolding chaperone
VKLIKSLTLAALVAAILLTAGTAVRAQESTTPSSTNLPVAGGGAKMRGPNVDYLAKQLGLTDDEKVKFSAAIDEQRQKLKSIMSDKSLSPQDRHSQVVQLRQDLNTELKGILTAEEFAKWEKLSTRHHPGPRPVAPAISLTNAPAASN